MYSSALSLPLPSLAPSSSSVRSARRQHKMHSITTGPLLRARLAPRAVNVAMTDAVTLLSNPAANPIAAAFEFVTLVPQPLWLLLVLLPQWKGTKAIFQPIEPLAVLALFHLLIVGFSTQGEVGVDTAPLDLFNNLFDAREDGLATYLQLGSYPNFAAEEWTHVLIWDLFVGRFIWLDGLKRGIFTSHSVLLTNLIGPPGLLLHLLTCLVLGKGLPTEDIPEEQEA